MELDPQESEWTEAPTSVVYLKYSLTKSLGVRIASPSLTEDKSGHR